MIISQIILYTKCADKKQIKISQYAFVFYLLQLYHDSLEKKIRKGLLVYKKIIEVSLEACTHLLFSMPFSFANNPQFEPDFISKFGTKVENIPIEQ